MADESCSRFKDLKSTRSKIQTLKNRLKTVTEASVQKAQTLQKNYEILEEKHKKLSKRLEAEKKKYKVLEKKNKELKDHITKMKSERQKEVEYFKKIDADTKDLLEEMKKELNSQKLRNNYMWKKIEETTELSGCKYESSV